MKYGYPNHNCLNVYSSSITFPAFDPVPEFDQEISSNYHPCLSNVADSLNSWLFLKWEGKRCKKGLSESEFDWLIQFVKFKPFLLSITSKSLEKTLLLERLRTLTYSTTLKNESSWDEEKRCALYIGSVDGWRSDNCWSEIIRILSGWNIDMRHVSAICWPTLLGLFLIIWHEDRQHT